MKMTYIGWYEGATQNEDEPNLISETISNQFEESLFKTVWFLENQGLISQNDAENMDTNLADELGIHIMGINTHIIKELTKLNEINHE